MAGRVVGRITRGRNPRKRFLERQAASSGGVTGHGSAWIQARRKTEIPANPAGLLRPAAHARSRGTDTTACSASGRTCPNACHTTLCRPRRLHRAAPPAGDCLTRADWPGSAPPRVDRWRGSGALILLLLVIIGAGTGSRDSRHRALSPDRSTPPTTTSTRHETSAPHAGVLDALRRSANRADSSAVCEAAAEGRNAGGRVVGYNIDDAVQRLLNTTSGRVRFSNGTARNLTFVLRKEDYDRASAATCLARRDLSS